MTPTLYGRWQTRILLFATVGVAITFLFSLVRGEADATQYLIILFWLAIFGLGWDIVYNLLQKQRWDRDWSAVLQFAAGCWEAVFIVMLINGLAIYPGGITAPLNLAVFVPHYSLVWLSIFVVSQSLMRICFPRWRFRGGQLHSRLS